MPVTIKPKDYAFVLREDKTEEFLAQKKSQIQKTLARFNAHKPKNGIVNPYKK